LGVAIAQRKPLLVFDAYHGTLDDVMVCCRDGANVSAQGWWARPMTLTQCSRSIPFNDVVPRLEAFGPRWCALLCEPAMTNIGMVPPRAWLYAEKP
jgi:glutamate-1-semialdehyde 2,1-aminomutase